jgi:hypothetical protein
VKRAYFFVCLGLGRLLRAARYSKTRIVSRDDGLEVRKWRSFYAPLLISLADPLVRILNTGVRILPQRDWEERERLIYESLYGTAIRIDRDGTLVLPHLAGATLATLLDDPALGGAARKRAIDLAVRALAVLHAQGFTHGDAMAANVMVDLEAGVAHWFDFETAHDPSRTQVWRRADDVRALLATCLLRTRREDFSETMDRIVDGYADEAIVPLLVTSFSSVFQRPLMFHLGQAGLSFIDFRAIGALLRGRLRQLETPARLRQPSIT